MNKTILLLLLGCAAYTNAIDASLRTKLKQLAQIKQGNTDAETEAPAALEDCEVEAPELGDLSGDLLDWCPEEFGAEGSQLGASILSAGGQHVSLSQNLEVNSVPDSMQNTTVQAFCHACNAAAHEEASTASRIRTFDIHGQICVEENIKFGETGEARERSQGASEKNGVCLVTNDGSDGGDVGTLAACDGALEWTPPSSGDSVASRR